MSEKEELTAKQADQNWRDALRKHAVIISSRGPEHVAKILKKKERMIHNLALERAAEIAEAYRYGKAIAKAIRKLMKEEE